MAPTKKLLIALTLAVIAGSAFWFCISPKEPAYQGKRLSDWLELYDSTSRHPNEQAKATSAGAVRAIGADAIPLLIEWLRWEPNLQDLRLLDKMRKLPDPIYNLGGVHPHLEKTMLEAYRQRELAMVGFGVLGAAGEKAIPELTRLLESKNPSVSLRAASALILVNKNSAGLVAPRVQQLCTNQNLYIRNEALKILARIDRTQVLTNSAAQ